MPAKFLRILIVSVLLAVAQVPSFSQAKIYTKKARLADFTARTMKVVVEGETPLAIDIRREVSSRWRLSPYEFCSIGEYEGLKADNDYYFLRFVADEGIAFLLLEKGGEEDDADRMKKPFEIVRVPVGSAGGSYSFGIANLDVFLDIIGMYVRKAMASDKYGYGGLDVFNASGMKGKTIVLNGAADELFAAAAPDTVVPIVFVPEPDGQWYYKMLVDAGTHELFFFDRSRFKKGADASFNAVELKSFGLRHAVISE